MAIDQAMAGDDGRALVLWLGALAAVYLVLSWSFRIGAYAGERAGRAPRTCCGWRSWSGCWTRAAAPRAGGSPAR